MIRLHVRELAEARGYRNAHRLQVAAGLATHVAGRLWRGEWERISQETLDKLCATLKCQPGDLLTYEPEKRPRK